MEKSFEDFVDYMWKIYPHPDQYSEREAMMAALNYLSGQYDKEEIVRKEIANEIGKMIKLKHKV